MPSFLKQVSGADRETVVSQRLTEPQPEFWGTQPGLRSGRDSSCNVGRVSGGPGGAWPRGHVEKGPVWAARRDGQWSISARPAPETQENRASGIEESSRGLVSPNSPALREPLSRYPGAQDLERVPAALTQHHKLGGLETPDLCSPTGWGEA